MSDIALDGVTLHHVREGSGRPCLVLHGGLGVDHVLYRRTLAPLADGFELVFYDHRGNGRSQLTDLSSITMEQLADDAAALCGALGLDRPLVFGHSYGGFVAQELALRHPGLLSGLVLADTTPGQLGTGESPGEEQGPPPPPEVLAALGTAPATDDELAAMMRGLLPFYFHRRSADEVASLLEGTVFRAAAMVRGFEVLAQWSSVDRLPQITVPTLLLAGRHDVFTSWPQSQRIAARLRDAEVRVFEESGHFPWIDEPDATFAALRDWAARTFPPPAAG